MPLTSLNHFTVRSADLKATCDFYVEVLGLADGPRPPFPFPGNWLYCGNQAVVHLVGVDHADEGGTGNFDHVAFTAQDADVMRRRFQDRGVSFKERIVPGSGLRQMFLTDPNNVTIELNFPPS